MLIVIIDAECLLDKEGRWLDPNWLAELKTQLHRRVEHSAADIELSQTNKCMIYSNNVLPALPKDKEDEVFGRRPRFIKQNLMEEKVEEVLKPVKPKPKPKREPVSRASSSTAALGSSASLTLLPVQRDPQLKYRVVLLDKIFFYSQNPNAHIVVLTNDRRFQHILSSHNIRNIETISVEEPGSLYLILNRIVTLVEQMRVHPAAADANRDLEANEDNEKVSLLDPRCGYGARAFERIRGHKTWPRAVRYFQKLESLLTALLGQHFLGTMSSTLYKEITEGMHAPFETKDTITYLTATVICQLVPTVFSYNNSLQLHDRLCETLTDSDCWRNSRLRTPIRRGHVFRILWGLTSALPASYAAFHIFFQNDDFPLVGDIPFWFRVVLTTATTLSAVKTNTNNIIQIAGDDHLEQRYMRNFLNLVSHTFVFSNLRHAFPDRMVWLVARIHEVIDKTVASEINQLDSDKLIFLLMQSFILRCVNEFELKVITAPPVRTTKDNLTQTLGGTAASYGYAQSFACAKAIFGDSIYLPFGVIIMGGNLSANTIINGRVLTRTINLLGKWRIEFSWEEIGKKEIGQSLIGLFCLLCNVTIVCMLSYYFPIYNSPVVIILQTLVSAAIAVGMSVASIHTRINAINHGNERKQFIPKGENNFIYRYQKPSSVADKLETSRILTFCEREIEFWVREMQKIVDDSTPEQLLTIMPSQLLSFLPDNSSVNAQLEERRQFLRTHVDFFRDLEKVNLKSDVALDDATAPDRLVTTASIRHVSGQGFF